LLLLDLTLTLTAARDNFNPSPLQFGRANAFPGGAMAVCPQCGNAVDASNRYCAVCGRDLTGPDAAMQPASTSPEPAPYSAPLGPPQTSGKAIASLIFGIFFFMIPTAILAIIFGHLSLSDIKKSAGRLQGRGLAITGLVLGYAGIAFIPLILIIAAIAIPILLRARMAANESSAVASVHAINRAELEYQTTYPSSGFTCRLESLGGSAGCTPSADHACLLDNALASGNHNGYIFELRNCAPAQEGGPIMKYQLLARPARFNSTGVRAFCTDESFAIRFDPSGSADQCLANGKPLQ
jgi:type II secretory pathway pseudopilin PulG